MGNDDDDDDDDVRIWFCCVGLLYVIGDDDLKVTGDCRSGYSLLFAMGFQKCEAIWVTGFDIHLAWCLDDSCLNEKDYSLCLMGKVMMEFQATKLNFQANSGMKSWFSQIHLASSDFTIDGRVTWVEIKGIPLKMWSKNTFSRVASKWGALLDVDDQEDGHFHRKRICINTNVSTNIFESFKLIYKGKVVWVRAKEVSGWIPDFVEDNEEEDDSEDGIHEDELNERDFRNVEDLEGDSDGEIVPDTKCEEESQTQKGEEDSVGHGEVVIMGDFNEVRNKSERFGTTFNRHGADVFNSFISKAGSEEVSLEGCSFTWCHMSATKMSKLNHFLISDSLLCSCPNISSITLDRYLSDHHPILMREVYYDYESNVVNGRMKAVNLLQEVEKMKALEAAQKAKIKWAIEGDENSKYYHGVINKKMNQLSIRGILVEGTWIDSPPLVKSEFLSHLKNRFEQPNGNRLHMDMHFSNTLNSDQVADLECQVSKDEIKKAVWDCGIDKSPGPDGFMIHNKIYNIIPQEQLRKFPKEDSLLK
ncbi:RNA-directed DNA polymerase, eukaryota, reverse transcriptase zinc-binding domain protein, partial [Tanacetum coccineum]